LFGIEKARHLSREAKEQLIQQRLAVRPLQR